MTIWKFPLTLTDVQEVSMPKGALPLSVQVQQGVPCLWALVDPEAPKVPLRLRIYGTGHTVDEPGRFLGTFQVHSGSLVFHVFQV